MEVSTLLNTIDAKVLKEAFLSGANRLCNHKTILNDLNVFPVPDGDTGSNMSMTICAAARELLSNDYDKVGGVMSAVASASLRGARGNSGVILSQFFRGMSKRMKECTILDVKDLAESFTEGVNAAYRAVMKPVEGTILSVGRDGAKAGEKALSETADIVQLMEAVILEAQKSLDRTPEILPQLKQAGVVDSGGQGILYLLEGALEYLKTGKIVELTDQSLSMEQTVVRKETEVDIKFSYCTEFIINKNSPAASSNLFRKNIETKGDSMVVIDDGEIIKVHIHTNNPGYVIEQALKLGALTDIKIDNMKYQHDSKVVSVPEKPAEEKEYGFAAVAAGDGLAQLFRDMGCDTVIEGGQTMNPSTDDILSAIEKISAKTIFVLPNNKNIIMAAEQVKGLTDKNVVVIPSRSVPQGMNAKLAFVPTATPEENEKAMSAAIKSIKTGTVTYAVREFPFEGKNMPEGTIIGLDDGKITKTGAEPAVVLKELFASMTDDDSEILSVFYGEDVSSEDAEALGEELEELYPDCDIVMHCGGQPLYYYILSVE
ncbi:MAG: DAK2 domain-containing protein [Clostridia bacterium]|nr:DAK2 domain-containing protein [Clostridia bacterium]